MRESTIEVPDVHTLKESAYNAALILREYPGLQEANAGSNTLLPTGMNEESEGNVVAFPKPTGLVINEHHVVVKPYIKDFTSRRLSREQLEMLSGSPNAFKAAAARFLLNIRPPLPATVEAII